MNSGNCRDLATVEVERFTYRDLTVHHAHLVTIGNFGKIGPNLPVEQMFLENLNRRRAAIDRDWPVPHPANGIDQKRNTRHVIKVRMSDKNMVDLYQLFNG